MTKPQFSKRDRGKKNAGPREPTYGYCPSCGDPVWNRGAHAEACPGERAWPNPGRGVDEMPLSHGEPMPGGIRPGPDTGHTTPPRCEAYTYSSGAFGVRKQCVRPWAHEGGHIY